MARRRGSTKKNRPMMRENRVNGGDEYPPSRPTWMTFLVGAALIAAGAIIVNSAAVSAFVHLPQIKSSLGF
jgi:hypothetical protein